MGEAAFLWRPGEAMLWHLNPTAQAVWALLAKPMTARALVRTLHQVFPDVPKDRMEADLLALLGAMAAEGLVLAES